MHRLKLLGGASLEGPSGPVSGAIAQRQRLAFLAILARAPTGLVSRDKLLALLWPDLDSGRARRALSNALYVIKKELGEESVTTVGDDLRFDSELVSVDVSEFESAVARGELEEAADLYSGPFLEGVHVKDGPEFEKWADGERDHLSAVHLEVLEGLAREATEEGRLMDAAGWWRKLAVQNPYSTRIALGLMEALANAGDRAGALRYAEIHATLLREEFGSEPDSALTDLEKRLRSDAPSPVPQPPHRQEQSHLSQPEAVATLPSASEEKASESPSEGRDGLSQASEPSGPTDPKALFAGAVRRIGKQKMVQWGLTYLAGAWFVIQFMDAFAEAWGISLGLQRGAFVVLFFGFLLTLVLVWYHGEEGRQRVSGPELLIIAALLVIAGGVLTVAGPGRDPSQPAAGLPGPGDPGGRPTIAVLPFENFSPDPEDAYFADGMHEEIISKFSKISALRVISRSSVMQFRENRPTVPEMAAQLGTDFFLEGSATVVEGAVRLTAQLIDANRDEHLWSADYERPLSMDNLLAVQSTIADSVASLLEATLTPEERADIEQPPTENLEAFRFFMRGRFLWNQRTEADMRRSIDLFGEAIEKDSLFALAYAGLADAYLTLLSWDFIPLDEAVALSEDALRRALDLDPLMGEAHTSLATVLYSRGDPAGARREFIRALELRPDYATGHHWFALFLGKGGFFQDALTHIRYAEGLDPLSRMIGADVGWILHMNRDYLGAVDQLELVTEREPTFAVGWARLGDAYNELGRYDEGIAAISRAVELEPWPNTVLRLAQILAKSGKPDEARRILVDVDPRHDPLREALVHVALGDAERGLELLEEGYRTGSPFIGEIFVEPQWAPVRSDPRFVEMLVRLGFQPLPGAG